MNQGPITADKQPLFGADTWLFLNQSEMKGGWWLTGRLTCSDLFSPSISVFISWKAQIDTCLSDLKSAQNTPHFHIQRSDLNMKTVLNEGEALGMVILKAPP